jgi:hypothetical protein
MKTSSIPQDKWIDVYNSVVLLYFFCHEYENNPASIQAINKRFNSFCSEKNIIGKDFHFEGGANTLSFCYLIIVRIIEIINDAVNDDGDARKQFFKSTLETAKQDGFTSFDDITAKHDIDIKTFADGGGKPDEEKLYQLFRHIRHSVSHCYYKIDLLQNKVDFKSVDPRTKIVKLDMAMPMYQLLTLTAQFGCWVNNTLHQEHLLS